MKSLNLSREKRIYIVTAASFIINAILVALKCIIGFFGNSHALVADAFHSLSDLVTDILVLVFVSISNKPRDSDHAYGHGKFETMATAIIGIALLFVGGAIFWDGIKIIWSYFHCTVLHKPTMATLWAALASIVLKEGLYWWTKYEGEISKSQALIANAWHHRTDSFSSIAVAAGICGAILFGGKWLILDPVMAIVVSIFIIVVSLRFIKGAVDELLEKSLPLKEQKEILEIVNEVKGFSDPHALCTRRIGNNIAIEIHLRFNQSMSIKEAHDIATEVEERLKNRYGKNTHVVTHLEV